MIFVVSDAPQEAERNTKPPALFWQGVVMTDWGRHWELWRVRLPVALYTLATAALPCSRRNVSSARASTATARCGNSDSPAAVSE